jgi:D-tyrosyl-tRNA(Tyr) deacylase
MFYDLIAKMADQGSTKLEFIQREIGAGGSHVSTRTTKLLEENDFENICDATVAVKRQYRREQANIDVACCA